jgi:hypothetical protein
MKAELGRPERQAGQAWSVALGRNGMNQLALAIAVALTITPAGAQTNTSWDGTWNGS